MEWKTCARPISVLALALLLLTGCTRKANVELVPTFESNRQWTAVAFNSSARTFVSYPRWSPDLTSSVDEILPTGDRLPYPSASWQEWNESANPADVFVCVQSCVMDEQDNLWVLDTGSPFMMGIVEGGPKLVKIDTKRDEVDRVYRFTAPVVEANSYLNDVRISPDGMWAYMTDSGNGALVVLNLESGEARRLLAGHPSTEAETVTLEFNGQPWVDPNGNAVRVHADGIALSPDGETLYYHALTGYSLWSVPTEALRNDQLGEEELAESATNLGLTVACDGMICDAAGDVYLTGIEKDAIYRYSLQHGLEEVIVNSDLLRWPDSFAMDRDGKLFVVTSQIQYGASPGAPYRVIEVRF